MEKEFQKNSYAKGFNQQMAKYRIQRIRDWCSGRVCLDIGCGEGDITRGLVDMFGRIWAIDISEDYLKEARRRSAGEINFVCSSIEEFECPETVDFVIAADILEHVIDPVEILRKIKKWTSRTGRLLIIVPNARSLHRRIGVEMDLIQSYYELGEQDHKVGHRRYYDLPVLERDLHQAGWELEKSSGILLKPFPNTQMLSLPEEYIDALMKIGEELPEYCAELSVLCRAA